MVQLISRMMVAAAPESLFEADPHRHPQHKVVQADPPTEDTPSLARTQLFERIMLLNTTATEEYLGTFSDHSLSRYLAHLESAGSPRGASWERPGDSPAILVRETAF